MANTTPTNIEAAPAAVKKIYEAWDQFCAWYQEDGNHTRGKKPTKWSKNVTNWAHHKQYPRPAQILKALEETQVASVSIEFDFSGQAAAT